MLLQHVLDIIESVAPLSYQENWDNSGLQVGNPSANVEAALLTIDITESVVDEAVSRGCQLIISHHPLLFHGLKQVCGQSEQARCVEKALRNGIAIYSAHTSMDCAPNGVSARMADMLGIHSYRILVGEEHGLGVIGDWDGTFEQLLARVSEVFHSPTLRYIPLPSSSPQGGPTGNAGLTSSSPQGGLTVALCGGAAAEFIDEAAQQGADVYLSADMKYHEMQAAIGRLALIDLDHWYSEQFTRDIFAELLEGKIQTYIAETDHSPIQIYR